MSLGTRTLNESARQPLSTADSDLRLSLGFLDSGAAKQANHKKTRKISGEQYVRYVTPSFSCSIDTSCIVRWVKSPF